MDIQFILIFISVYLLVDRIMSSTRNKENETTMNIILNMQKQFIDVINTQNRIAAQNGVTFEETKEILDTMVDEYLENVYSLENERLFLIKDKEFPTDWEGVYLYPNKEKQLDQLQRLKTSIQRYASDTFKDRLRIFYTDTYIQEYVSKLVEDKYYARLILSEENARVFRKTCATNLEKLQKEQELSRKKEIADKHKRLNSLLTKLSYQPYLPENVQEVDDKDRVEGVDTHKLLRGRYILNKQYYDDIAKNIEHENDIFTGAEKYARPDDKLVSYLAKEFNWDSIQPDPHTVEEEKFNVAEICMRYELNPIESGLFGKHDTPTSITENYKGKVYDMDGKRLNNIFYLTETYGEFYTNINEASIAEGISSIFV